MNGIEFLKMHGLGNDFVVLDARTRPLAVSPAAVRRIADRRTGVGCDQIVVIGPAKNDLAEAHVTFLNADGGEAGACGNGSRCVAALLMRETKTNHVVLETVSGLLDCETDDGEIAVDLGPARLDWRDIPLSQARDTLHLGIEAGPLKDPVGVGLGNPHAVFFVPDAEKIALETLGPQIENHSLFPERANVEVAQIISPSEIRLRVWERGAGLTRACGTGACAALVAASRRGLAGRKARIKLDGGTLAVEWLPDNHVLLTGPVATSFAGTLDAKIFEDG
ncbi:MAG: diaminopimelate epimerase [Rhodospirillales bacterium]|nr:diaminopimelate epimerase [Rhodospirillales bacterium]MSP80140.1 diaminopimelate epimerase [Rhodospirillales bacterium]